MLSPVASLFFGRAGDSSSELCQVSTALIACSCVAGWAESLWCFTQEALEEYVVPVKTEWRQEGCALPMPQLRFQGV